MLMRHIDSKGAILRHKYPRPVFTASWLLVTDPKRRAGGRSA